MLFIIDQSHAEAFPSHSRMVLMTENFPPFNMSVDGKNFSRDANITGSNTAVIREMFKRAGIPYHLSLRFPWDRMYNLVLEKDNYALFSVTLNDTRKPDFQ
ncbi:amino acid ABC transporter substrate-binding protein, partial [Pseudomonas sp. OA3]|nr:amino acid ABC transporter substrate-binding protein [Pseudomonas sp. OA3]